MQSSAASGKEVCGFQEFVDAWPFSRPASGAALQPVSVKLENSFTAISHSHVWLKRLGQCSHSMSEEMVAMAGCKSIGGCKFLLGTWAFIMFVMPPLCKEMEPVLVHTNQKCSP